MMHRALFWGARLTGAAPLVLLATLVAQGCQGDGFECGRPIGGSDEVRRCDRSLEICVCATNSCARRVGPTASELDAGADAGAPSECPSGFRYVEAPFAKRAIAGSCVPESDLGYAPVIENDAPSGTLCPGAVLPPDASAGSGGKSGTGGMDAGGAGGEEPSGGTAGASASGGTAGASASGGTSGDGGTSGQNGGEAGR